MEKVCDNVKLDIAIEIMSTKIAVAINKKDELELKHLLEEKEELYLGNWNIINKILNEYSDEVNNFALNKKSRNVENAKLGYQITEEQYDEMYKKCRYITFFHCEMEEKPIAVFVGGQTGSGKGGIDVFSKQELLKENKNVAILDVDVYRALYPYTNEIMKECPTLYTEITAKTTGKILKNLMAEAIENRYDFIFEGTLRNTEALETMKKMPKYYKKYVRIMATSDIESLLTAFERNYEQIKISGYGRFTNVETHNITYNGVLETLKAIEASNENITIEIFKRGKDMTSPIRIYSSDFDNEVASKILMEQRTIDRNKFKIERKKRFNNLINTLQPKDEFEKMQIEKLIKEETTYARVSK